MTGLSLRQVFLLFFATCLVINYTTTAGDSTALKKKEAPSVAGASSGDMPARDADAVEYNLAWYYSQTAKQPGCWNCEFHPTLNDKYYAYAQTLGDDSRTHVEGNGIVSSVDGSDVTVDGYLQITITGSKPNNISIQKGGFSVAQGLVSVRDGTVAVVDSARYVRTDGAWRKVQETPREDGK